MAVRRTAVLCAGVSYSIAMLAAIAYKFKKVMSVLFVLLLFLQKAR